jgi:pimeloyl-ACP methyl ester carboxylesterase
MPTLEIDGLPLAYEIRGEGPPLLLIMGFTGSRYQWLGLDRLLARSFRVISFDNRGVGESGAPPGPYTIRQMALDALGLLDALELPRAAVLGVSMGGMIAQEFALAAPHRVEKLILGCTHAGGPRQIFADPETLQRIGPQQRGRDPRETLRTLLEVQMSDPFRASRDDVVEDLIAYGLSHRMPQAGFSGQLRAITAHDTRDRLGQITSPTLVISGDQDRLIPPENSSVLAQSIPGARLEWLAGAGHMFWIEQADETTRRVTAFLQGS